MYVYVVLWWISSSIYSSYNRILLKNTKDVCLPLELSLYECLVMCVVEYILSKRAKIRLHPACGILTFFNTTLGNTIAVYSTVHFSQMLKFAEPILILIITSVMFKQSIEKEKLLYAFVILLGSFIYSLDTEFNVYSVMAVFSSSLRSILLKKRMATEEISNVLFDAFLTSSILCLVSLVAHECTLVWHMHFTTVVFSFLMYNMISNRILKLIDTSLHSIGKIGKRVMTILLSLVLVKEHLSVQQGIGITIMTVGMFLFVHMKRVKPPGLPTSKLTDFYSINKS